MRLEVLKAGARALRRPTRPVKNIDGKLNNIILNKFRPAMRYEAGYGLAANQLGYSQSFFVWERPEGLEREFRVLINPEILEFDGEATYKEGCLSIPGLFFPIKRPDKIYIKGVDQLGEEFAFEATGLEARIIQHEVDHLNGQLIFDLLDQEQLESIQDNKWYLADQR